MAWWYGGKNWGDILTPFLIQRLSGKRARRALRPGAHFVVGSILHRLRMESSVWGTGAISPRHIPKPLPSGVTFHAVRGPKTRAILQAAGAEVPDIYGDPALLAPYLFQAEPCLKWDVGVIPHYNDTPVLQVPQSDSIQVINIEAGLNQVVQEVLSCACILSSSLHGLVLADAYGIPAAWLQVDEGARLVGRKFKFVDYLLSTGREPITTTVRGDQVLDPDKAQWLPKPDIDIQRLLDACPFKRPEIKSLADIPKC